MDWFAAEVRANRDMSPFFMNQFLVWHYFLWPSRYDLHLVPVTGTGEHREERLVLWMKDWCRPTWYPYLEPQSTGTGEATMDDGPVSPGTGLRNCRAQRLFYILVMRGKWWLIDLI
jgi:hypothetical protein